MPDLLISPKEQVFSALQDLFREQGSDQEVAVSQFVRTMLDKGLTADESMGLLQDLIADERVQLTNTYRLRAAE